MGFRDFLRMVMGWWNSPRPKYGGLVCATTRIEPRVRARAGIRPAVSATAGAEPRVLASAGVEEC